MAEENTCTICLESLFKDNCTDLGVCNPCGHPYHVSCFRQWEASKIDYTGDRSRVKCPYCSSRSEGFTKIYLSAPTIDYGIDDEDDDSSVSSVESAANEITNLAKLLEDEDKTTTADDETEQSDGKPTETEEVMEDNQPESPTNQPANHAENDEVNLDVVDLTASPEPKKNNSNKKKNTAATDDEAEAGIKIKRKMKHYRKQAKQLKSRLQESSKQSRQLLEKHNEMKQKVKQAEKSKIEFQSSHEQNMMELQEKRLENVTLKRQLTKEKQDLQRSEEKYTELSNRFSRFEKASNDRLEQIRKCQNVETQKMLAEFPKLKDENKRLMETNERQKKYLAEIRAYMKKLDPDIRERVERNVGREPGNSNAGIMNQRQLKEGLMTFQDMTEGSQKRKRTEQSATHKLASTHRGARVEQARAPKKANINISRDVDAVFSKLDNHRKQTAVPAGATRRVSTDITDVAGGDSHRQQTKGDTAQRRHLTGSNAPKNIDSMTAQRQQQHKGSNSAHRYESKGDSASLRQKTQGSTNAQRLPSTQSMNLPAKSKRKPLAPNRALFSKKSKGTYNGDIRTWF